MATSKEVDKFANLERWLLENGAKFPKVYLKDYGNEVRGCHASVDIDNDEVIVDIPLSCLISVEMGKETEIGKIVIEKNIELEAPKHIFLMLFMLTDRRNQDSFFKPYYDILPPTLSNMPIFWSPAELKYLEGSPVIVQVEERNQAIQEDYESICSVAPQFKGICSLDEFKWARMCVCSRNFGLIVNNIKTAVLVPYADMLNHYRPRETKWYFDEITQSFRVASLQTISAGAQVYDSYGQKCNHRFLLNYGFSVENNCEPDCYCPNEVVVELTLSAQQSHAELAPGVQSVMTSPDLHEHKVALWQRECSSLSRKLRVSAGDNEMSRLMFALVRVIVADDADYIRLISNRSGGSGGYRSVRNAFLPVSIRNEILTLQHLKSICITMIYKYPTTLEQDRINLREENIVNYPLYSNKRNALIQVKGEKEVWHHYLDLAECGLKLLLIKEGQEELFDSELEEIRKCYSILIFQYCANVVSKVRRSEYRRNSNAFKNLDLTRPTIV